LKIRRFFAILQPSTFSKMACILALDVGGKRTGMAVSDEGRIFAFPLETVPTGSISPAIRQLLTERNISSIVIGIPVNLKNQETDGTRIALQVKQKLEKEFPHLPVSGIDERFTSRMARQALLDGGMKKSDRRQKENTDKVSAALILQSYLEQQSQTKR
jgi:putative Holliday junction resolvase